MCLPLLPTGGLPLPFNTGDERDRPVTVRQQLSLFRSLRQPILKDARVNELLVSGGRSVSGRFSLDGGMIPRSVKRVFDQRSEERVSAESQTAVLEFRGRKHVVRLVNISPSGAMIIFPLTPNIGEEMSLQLLDRAAVRGRVMWVRDGRIGVSFVASKD
jgi:hypothetical protein